ncbi:MAG: DUF4367 domain-containing protein [Eubacterium sp.]|nr:DUF4367 domain-containing protein [Eubacterium sp.]
MNIDDMIAAALKEEFEERAEKYSADAEKHRFSLSYKLWEHKILRDLRRDRVNMCWTLKKARAAVALWLAAAFVLVGGTVFAAVNMGRYAFDTNPEYSKLFIENVYSDKTSIEEYYGLPNDDGWQMVDRYADNMGAVLNYENGDKKVTLRQDIIDGNMGHINTEDAVVEPVSLHEENDSFFIAFKGGGGGLYWTYEGYFFRLLGNITKNEAINLAYSIKIINL